MGAEWMYGKITVVAGATTVGTLEIAKVLPTTGASLIEQAAIAVAVGMIAWAVYYIKHQ